MEDEDNEMNSSRARVAAGASVLLAPLLMAVGDHFRMRAQPPEEEVGIVTEWGVQQAMAELVAIDAHRGAYEFASWIYYLAAILTIPALVLLWRLALAGSRRWAWAGAILGVCSVVGQFVHLSSYFGANQVLASQPDLEAAARFMVDWNEHPYSLAVFAPYLVGVILAPLAQAIALRRARVIPLWSLLAVLAGTVLFGTVGSTPMVSVVWGVLMVGGFAPAVRVAIWGSALPQQDRQADPVTV